MLRGLAVGVSAGLAFGVASEGYRIVRGSTRACSKCTAPVGADGIWRGEREHRSLTLQWSVHPLEWMARERVMRRRKCCQCQKALDSTSVIVNDRTWHRKCLRCHKCEKPLKGHRYRMINNKIYDDQCYREEKADPLVKRSHTNSISWVMPDPTTEPNKSDGLSEKEKREEVRKVVDAIAVLKKAKRLAEERKRKRSESEPPTERPPE